MGEPGPDPAHGRLAADTDGRAHQAPVPLLLRNVLERLHAHVMSQEDAILGIGLPEDTPCASETRPSSQNIFCVFRTSLKPSGEL